MTMHDTIDWLSAIIPPEYQRPADLVLAGVLVSGPLGLIEMIEQANMWVALIGGLIGLFIGLVRVYEILRTKRERKKED